MTVGGLVCRDRLESLQRIFEHELLHLAEFLGWGRSNCRADNFHALSRRIFAHEGAFHDLITPREQARAAFNIHVGDRVSFELDGARHVGRVNRITRRATVLVENPRGSFTPTAGTMSPATCRYRFCVKKTRRPDFEPGVEVGADHCHLARFGRS